MKETSQGKGVVFVTGTDTGAGKTLLTALLVSHLRLNGCNSLAVKPFCSGGREDLELLSGAQDHQLPESEMNCFYSPEPVAPLMVARRNKDRITLSKVIKTVYAAKKRSEMLFVEGAGGLLAPLGEGFSNLEIVKKLGCPVLVAARNRLGVINHVRLTIAALERSKTPMIIVVLMGCEAGDISVKWNRKLIEELAPGARVFEVPFLGREAGRLGGLKKSAKKIKKTLARICGCVRNCPVN